MQQLITGLLLVI